MARTNPKNPQIGNPAAEGHARQPPKAKKVSPAGKNNSEASKKGSTASGKPEKRKRTDADISEEEETPPTKKKASRGTTKGKKTPVEEEDAEEADESSSEEDESESDDDDEDKDDEEDDEEEEHPFADGDAPPKKKKRSINSIPSPRTNSPPSAGNQVPQQNSSTSDASRSSSYRSSSNTGNGVVPRRSSPTSAAGTQSSSRNSGQPAAGNQSSSRASGQPISGRSSSSIVDQGDDEDEEDDEGLVPLSEEKQKAVDELLEALQKKDRGGVYKRRLNYYKKQGRLIPRVTNAYMPIGDALARAVRLDLDLPFERQVPSEVKDINKDEYDAIVHFYKKMLEVCPRIDLALDAVRAGDTMLFDELCSFLQKRGCEARRDDVGRLNKMVLSYLPNPIANIRKSDRGWNHEVTARLLCPQTMLGEFDQDWHKFAHNAVGGEISINEWELPFLLWDEKVMDPLNISTGLLQAEVLLACYRNVFTGPRNATNTDGGVEGGKPGVAIIYGIRHCSPESIGYIAALTRFALSSQTRWATKDGDFDYAIFARNVTALLDVNSSSESRRTWAKHTLEWWDMNVFGEKPEEFKGPTEKSATSLLNKVFAQQDLANTEAPSTE